MTDDLVQFARLYRREAAAALVDIVRDEGASANARAQAARDILSYSDGKPQQAKQVTLTDLDKLTQQERVSLLYDLMQRCESETGIIQAMMRDAVIEAAAIAASNQPTPRFGFRRGNPMLALPTPPALQIDAELRPRTRGRAPAQAGAPILHRPPDPAHEGALQPSSNQALPPPRSPAHSPLDPNKPSHFPNGMPIRRIGDGDLNPDGGNGQDKWTSLLNGYNAAKWRNGHGR
jgi:hypothetical protein